MSIVGELYRELRRTARDRAIFFRGVCTYHLKVLIIEHFALTYDEVDAQFLRLSDAFWESDAMDTPDGWRGVAWLVALNSGADLSLPPLPVTIQ